MSLANSEPPRRTPLDDWWDRLVVSLELADLADPGTRGRLDSAAAKANSQGVQAAAAWNYGGALPMLTAAIEVWGRLGQVAGEIGARNTRGAVYRKIGDYAAASVDHDTALILAREIGSPEAAITAQVGLGAARAAQDDLDRAEALLDAALEQSAATDRGWGAAPAHYWLGLVREARRDWDAALGAYGTAVERWRALSAPVEAIEATAGVARVVLAQGQAVAAYGLAEEVLRHLAERGPARLDEPLRVYWTLYRVLHVTRQEEDAHELLRAAYRLMIRQAEGLAPEQRAMFREQVAVNRAIAEAWASASAE